MSIECVDAAPCGSFVLHGEHSWRTGFLLLKKEHCSGSPTIHALSRTTDSIREAVGLPPIHRHSYELRQEFDWGSKKDSDILWACKGCSSYFVTSRRIFWDHGVWYDVK